MLSGGYFQLGRLRGAPIRIHWSAPIGAFAFTGFSLRPALWAGWLFLVIWHELGHAALVRRYGYSVTGVRVHAFGGDCQWSGEPTSAEVAAVAWGGVLAQALLWVVTTVLVLVLGHPTSPILSAIAITFTVTNAYMIVFNLLPIPPLDGYRAWSLFKMLWDARRERRAYFRERAERRRAKDREIERARAHTASLPEPREAKTAVDFPADTHDDRNPPPMPPELRSMLDRIVREVGEEQRAKSERDRKR